MPNLVLTHDVVRRVLKRVRKSRVGLGSSAGPRLAYLISVAVVTFGKIVHEGVKHAVLVALGARLPARHINVPEPRLAGADDAGEAAVGGQGVLDHVGVELAEQ